MKKIKLTAAMLAMVMLLGVGCSSVKDDTEETTEETYSRSDIKPIRAQDDFYGYVNLDTLKNLEIPADNYAAGSIMEDHAMDELKEIVLKIVKDDKTYPEGSCEQIVKRAYEEFIAYQDDKAAQKSASEEVHKMLAEITAVKDLDGLLEVSSKLYHDYGVSGFLGIGVDTDLLDREKYSVICPQTKLICGADLKEIHKDSSKAADYEKGIIDALQVSGMSYKEAEAATRDLMYHIIDITWATDFDIAESNDPYAFIEKIDKSEINNNILTRLTTEEYEKLCGIDNPYDTWLVLDKGQLAAIDSMVCEENLEALKTALIYEFVMSYGSFIAQDHDILRAYFPDSKEAMDEQAFVYLSNSFELELSDMFIKYGYTDEEEKLLIKICEDLRESYRDMIGEADWLSKEARESLTKKLDNIIFMTPGFCKEQIKDDPSDNDIFGKSLYETYRNTIIRSQQESIDNIKGTPDRLKVLMSMQSLNACYSQNNTVTICMGIMTDPWLDVSKDYYTNLGGLGAVIAHEIGHAFDSNNIKYNEDCIFDPSWIPAEDMEKLEKRNEAAVSYFEDNFTVYGVYRVDGDKTLGENYADLGGMEAVMNICETDDQRKAVFEQYGSLWCMLCTENDVIAQIDNDVHSPSIIRTNAIVAALDEFYEVYDVKEGDGMYVSPDKRAHRWR